MQWYPTTSTTTAAAPPLQLIMLVGASLRNHSLTSERTPRRKKKRTPKSRTVWPQSVNPREGYKASWIPDWLISQITSTLARSHWFWVSLKLSCSLLDMACEVGDWHDIKALPHKIESRTFSCLQAVNYLTSTHNEQCKTSRNLIKRQRQGPSADGKWLTLLIKQPSISLNMASLSYHLKYVWDPLDITIFPLPFCL